jgi:hypothetical protein
MNSNEVVARLEQTNLSNEEKQLVRDKIAAGSINPSGWMYLNDLDLSLSLRNNIRGIYLTLIIVPHSKSCIIYLFL